MTVLRRINSLLLAVALGASSLYAQQPILSLPELARLVSPSVVLITTRDQEGNPLGQGSGFIVSSDGLIATNLHVIEGASAASVQISNGDIYDTVLVADVDRRRDLALLSIKALNLHPAKLGDSEKLQVGQHVATVGNPSGLAGSLSDGIISAIRQVEGMTLLQITAPISHGSSGGPLLNDSGEVIGFTRGAIEGQNLNIAVPVNYLKPLITFLNRAVLTTLADFNVGNLRASAESAKTEQPKTEQYAKSALMDGAWSATISDAKSSAALQFNLVQNAEGEVVGTYTTSLGGGGRIKGTTKDLQFTFELTQSIRDCPGIFKGVATVEGDKASGAYTGTDCQGDHGKGTFTMTRGGQATTSTPPQPPSPTVAPQQVVPQVVAGQESELRGVKLIFVSAEKNLPARNEIVRLLNENGFQTVTDPKLADLGLIFVITFSSAGELVQADVIGQAVRANPPSGLRKLWDYNDRVVKRNVKEQDIARDFVKAFLIVYKRANRR